VTGESLDLKVKSPGRVTVRQRQRMLTGVLLIAAAKEVFKEKGYIDTTVEEIVERACASKATFYAHYSNKWKILDDTLDEYHQSYKVLYERFRDFVDPTVQDFADWFSAYVDLFSQHKLLLEAFHQAEIIEPEFRGRTLAEVRTYLAMWEEAGILHRGSRTPAEVEARAVLLFAQIKQFMYIWQIQGLPLDRAHSIRALAEYTYEVVYGVEAPR
jgi:AcrR family transcriptional regulator